MPGGLQERLGGAFGVLGGSMESIRENTVDVCSSTRLAELCGTLREKSWLRHGSRVDELGYL